MKEIRNIIVKGIKEDLDIEMILVDDRNNVSLPYPFSTFNFITSLDIFDGEGNYKRELVDSTNDKFEHDILETRDSQPNVTMSINTYSKNKLESQELAIKMRDWFRHTAYQYLSDNNIVIVDVLALQDRTIELINSYEYRTGFDVIIRAARSTERRLETIETANMLLNDEEVKVKEE